jgi:hypothetical protein
MHLGRCAVFVFLLASLVPTSTVFAHSSELSRQVRVEPADLSFRDLGGLTRVELRQGSSLLPSGSPDLPVLPVVLLLPEGTRAASVQVTPIESADFPVSGPLAAVGPTVVGAIPAPPRAARGDGDVFIPRDALVGFHGGWMRGQPIVSVAVAPVSWRESTGTVRLWTRFQVTVTLEAAGEDPGRLQMRRESPEGERSFRASLRALTGEDPKALLHAEPPRTDRRRGGLAPLVNSAAPLEAAYRPSVDGSPVDMVIITSSDEAAEYQRLADFKTRTGIYTVVRTLDWIRANYPGGVDNQESIRLFIRDAVSQWGTAYVLLGGDANVVPARYVHAALPTVEDIPCDLYYSDVDGNWNADGDSRFGEAQASGKVGDLVDMYPDVWVGRLPSRDVSEASVMVDKTLAYEQSPPAATRKKVVFASEVLSPSSWTPGTTVVSDGAAISEGVVDSLSAGTVPVRLYENYAAYAGALPETKQAVIDTVNDGCALFHHIGHGHVNVMSLGLGGLTIDNSDVDALHNGNRTFLLYASNCVSAAIDYNSIGQRFLANADGGAIAVIGSTRETFSDTQADWIREFYSLLFQQQVQDLGRTAGLTKIPFISLANFDNPQRWSEMSQIYLGDPTLSYWLDVPDTLVVSHASAFTLGQGTFTVGVTRNGSPAEGARVALVKDGDAYATGVTDAFGQVVVPFQPDLPGTVSVGVFQPDALPYLGSAQVTTPPGAYLYVESQTIDDDQIAPSWGNGDGEFDAGETVELRLTIRNSGTTAAAAFTASIANSDPYLTVGDGNSSFGDIAAGASGPALDPMVITVGRGFGERHEAHVTLTLTGPSGIFNQDLILYLHSPQYEYFSQSIRDTVGNGNGNGTIEASEDFSVVPSLLNSGLGEAYQVSARLRSTDPGVTVTDSMSVIGDIMPGDVGANPADGFALRLDDPNTTHAIQVVAVDAYGEEQTWNVEFKAPGTVSGLIAYGGANSITLDWTQPADTDLRNYNVYRAPTASGPFTRVNPRINAESAIFVDESLASLTRYSYKIAAVDSSGNEGPMSTVVSATTSLPLHAGWPVEVKTTTVGGVSLARLDGVGNPEILAGGEEIYALTSEGGDYTDGDHNSSTLGPLTHTSSASFWNTPTSGDALHTGYQVVAAAGWSDDQLHVVDRFGNELPGWPKDLNPDNIAALNPIGSPVMGDLDGDGLMEIAITAGKYVFAWHADGTELRDGDSNPATDGVLAATGSVYSYGTPSIADIDGNGSKEIIAGMRDGKLYVFKDDGSPYPGFPFVTGGDITTGPAIGDIDGDGRQEIVFGSSTDAELYAIRSDGSSATGFPVPIALNGDWDSSPALADLNGDLHPDVVIGASSGGVYAINGVNGALLPGFPVPVTDSQGNSVSLLSSPAVVDLNGDGSLDIVIADHKGRVHAYSSLGAELPGFPIQTGNATDTSPLVWDVDGDGLNEVLIQSLDQKIYCWDTPWTFDPTRAPWPMFKHDERRSGSADDAILQILAAPTTPPVESTLLMQNAPNPFRGSTVIRYRIPEGSSYRSVRLRVFDLNGRVVRNLVDGEQPPGSYSASWDGRDARGVPVASGIYLYRLEVAGRALSRKLVVLQ